MPVTESIGSARLREDGSIELMIRATQPNGDFGEAMFIIPPDDKRYDNILAHVGGLEPGEAKPVPPFD